jgi:hypothetical protein
MYFLILVSGEEGSDFFVTWKTLPPGSPSPCAREMFSACVVPKHYSPSPSPSPAESCLVISGGRSIESVLSDVWILEPAPTAEASLSSSSPPFMWRQLSHLELPHPRCAHSGSILPPLLLHSPAMLLFGGFTGLGISEDIIVCELSAESLAPVSSLLAETVSWRVVQPASDPDGLSITARFGHSMCPMPSSCSPVPGDALSEETVTPCRGVLVFGGIDAERDYNDMWILEWSDA